MNRRSRHADRRDPAELNITAFMNLMVVLVPFLLITAVFSRMAVLELYLPNSATDTDDTPETPQLEVIVRANDLILSDRNGSLGTFQNTQDGYDLDALAERLKILKSRFPDKTDIAILMEPEIEYDVLVQVMDTVRTVRVERDGEWLQAELFPDIAIGDAPIVTTAARR